MAFKMNKSVFNFGEGTGSSPNKFISAMGMNAKMLRMQADAMDSMRKPLVDKMKEQTQAEGSVVTDPQAQNAGDPNIEAKKARKFNAGQTTTADEKMNAISKIINS